MEISEAFFLINNLDYEEGLKRKLAPKHSLVQLNRNGKIEAVYRYKYIPTEFQYTYVAKLYPRTIQLPTYADSYEAVEEFQARIDDSMWLFSKMKD